MAVKELRKFFSKNGRKPTSNDKGMSKYHKPVLEGKWIEFGVKGLE